MIELAAGFVITGSTSLAGFLGHRALIAALIAAPAVGTACTGRLQHQIAEGIASTTKGRAGSPPLRAKNNGRRFSQG